MRQDQYEKLQSLSEKLMDALLWEADPERWSGDGLSPRGMSTQERGDRYWCKKNAVATAALIHRVMSLAGRIQLASNVGAGGAAGEVTPAEDGIDSEIAAAEREGARMLNQLLQRERASAGHGAA